MLLILLSGGASPPPPSTGSQNTWAQGTWGDVPWAGSQLTQGAYSLALDAGSYSLTGRDVTLTYVPAGGTAYSLSLDAGSYALTGRSVTLTWSGETPVVITDTIITLRSLTERWRM